MKYRMFRDHAGRVHRVEVKAEEIRAKRLYWAGVYAVSVLFLIVTSIAAGVL